MLNIYVLKCLKVGDYDSHWDRCIQQERQNWRQEQALSVLIVLPVKIKCGQKVVELECKTMTLSVMTD